MEEKKVPQEDSTEKSKKVETAEDVLKRIEKNYDLDEDLDENSNDEEENEENQEELQESSEQQENQEEEVEEENPPMMDLSYEVNQEEMSNSLIHSNFSGGNLIMSIVACAIGGIGFIYYFIKAISSGINNYYLLSLMCLGIILIATAFQIYMIKSHVKKMNDKFPFRMRVYSDRIEMGPKDNAFVMEMNGQYQSEIYKEMLIIYVKRSIVILPKRCCDEETFEKIYEIVKAGTKSRKK
ncbi:hypothetical protein ACVS9P_00225 [Caproicibacterium sp. NSD3]